MGIFGYKEWKSSHLSVTALELLILGATEGWEEGTSFKIFLLP